LLALGTLDELLVGLPFAEQIRIARNPTVTAQLDALGKFGEIAETEEAFVLTPRDGLRLSDLFAAVEQLGLSYRYFSVTRPTLENVFLHLTGKTLRDA
jgi:ABC-2 type transport system ATP-binding protein